MSTTTEPDYDDIDYQISVMQGFKERKLVQVRMRNNTWVDIQFPNWNWAVDKYRIKPEPPQTPYIPFTYDDAEELIGKTVKAATFGYGIICAVYISTVWVGTNTHISFETLLREFTFFPSGKPCGKEVKS